MHHLKKSLWAAGAGTCLLGCLAMSGRASAEAISYDSSGTIHSATSQFSVGTFSIGDYGYSTRGSAIGGYRGGAGPSSGFTSSGFSGYGGGGSSSVSAPPAGFLSNSFGGPVIGSPTGNPGEPGGKGGQGPNGGTSPGNGSTNPPGGGGTNPSGGHFGTPPFTDSGSAGSVVMEDVIVPLDEQSDDFGGAGSQLGTPTPLPTTAIPEPGALALFGGGLLGLALLRRRRKAA